MVEQSVQSDVVSSSDAPATPEDLSLLFLDPTVTTKVEFAYRERTWRFAFRQISWHEQMTLFQECLKGRDGSFSIDIVRYTRTMLIRSIVEAPWPLPTTALTLSKLDPRILNFLSGYIPNPLDSIKVENGMVENEMGKG